MVRRLVFAVTLLLATFSIAAQTRAGGWASVRVTGDPGEPVLGRPWTATLLVQQHDVTPVDVDELAVRFTHQESGATLDAAGEPTGETGRYRVAVTFDQPGLWDWQATPAPFGPTTMRTLDVAEEPVGEAVRAFTAELVTGTCAQSSSGFGSLTIDQADGGAATGVTAGLAYATKYLAGGPTAVVVRDLGQRAVIACGELPVGDLTRPIVVLLDAADGAGYAGALTLTPTGVDVVAALVVLPPQSPGVVIRITDEGGGTYAPSGITVPAGTTVTWVNATAIGHTVSGRSPGFSSSGMLGPGERFSQTFASPGTYAFACDPHPWMEGAVAVVA